MTPYVDQARAMAFGNSPDGAVEVAGLRTGEMRTRSQSLMLTFRIPQLKRREVITQDLRISIVALTIPAATAKFTAGAGSAIRRSFSMGLTGFLVHILSINSLLQILYPRVDLGLRIQETFSEVLANDG